MKSQKWPLNRNYLSKLKTPPQNDFQIHTISQTVWILVSSCVKEKKIVTHQYQVLQKWTTKPQLYLLNFGVDCSQYDCEVLKRSHHAFTCFNQTEVSEVRWPFSLWWERTENYTGREMENRPAIRARSFPAKLMRPIETQHSRAKLLKA